jgi:hypothetical protein
MFPPQADLHNDSERIVAEGLSSAGPEAARLADVPIDADQLSRGPSTCRESARR